jgi:hypothetical protein
MCKKLTKLNKDGEYHNHKSWSREDELKMAKLIRQGRAKRFIVETPEHYLWRYSSDTVQACAIGIAYFGAFMCKDAALATFDERRSSLATWDGEFVSSPQVFANVLDVPVELLHAISSDHGYDRNALQIAEALENGTFWSI